MTIERRIIAGITDIKTVRLKCKCGTEQVFLVDALMGVGGRCSNTSCSQPWTTADAESLKRYFEAFYTLRTTILKSSPFEICFEFPDPA
jgi:hypothetical protein